METDNNTKKVLLFPEKLNLENTPEFEAECKEQLQDVPADAEVIIDLQDLVYISSAGLRLILRLSKKYPSCIVANVSNEVYSILEMTGFVSFLTIRRKPMIIPPVEGEPIARGSNGEIYAIEDDTIVKMFTDKTSLEEIEEEWANARTAVSLGIPSVICFAVVNDGTRNGIMFEKLQTKTLDRLIYSDYDNFDQYGDMFAELFYTIHQTRDLKKGLSSVIKQQLSYVERAHYLSESEREQLKNFLLAVPETDTVIHGDFHPRNIGMADGELIAMDMAEIGYGHPVFDFVSTYYDLVFSGKTFPSVTSYFFGLEIPDLRRLWDRMLQWYFKGLSREDADWINEMLDELVGLRTILLPVLHPNKPKEKHDEWIRIGREKLTGKLEELNEKIRIFDEKFIQQS